MKIYNTISRKKEEFKPIIPGHVGIYVCGVTVYGPPHLGHAKSYINFDMVVRYLRFLGYKVKHVENVTDVGHIVGDADSGEDKIMKQAVIEKIDPYEIAYKYEVMFFDAMDKLNVLRPSISCRATGFISDMIPIIQNIIDKGYAYVTKNGNVYFEVNKYKKYGQLSNRKLNENLSGERIQVADDKRNPEDFALWKAADKNVLMRWNSPWGMGCPGWHIECTTLGYKFLGENFDIHGGGIDNMFPHHECELAQGDTFLGHLPMNYFMHNGLITVNGVKMSKSLKNYISLEELMQKYDPMVIRYYIGQFHYRSNVDINFKNLDVADKQYKKINEAVNFVRNITSEESKDIIDDELLEIEKNMYNAMDEDFNVPVALVEFNKIVKLAKPGISVQYAKQLNKLINGFGEKVFGFIFTKQQESNKDLVPDEIKKLAEDRILAKKEKNYVKADEIRNKITELGYIIKDTATGYEIEKK